MRGKLIAIVAILWMAAVVAISVAFYANPNHELVRFGTYENGTYTGTVFHDSFKWGAWLAWTGTATLVAVVAIAIIAVVFRRKEA